MNRILYLKNEKSQKAQTWFFVLDLLYVAFGSKFSTEFIKQ